MPKKVDDIVESLKEEGHDESSAWAIAWNTYCEDVNPDSKHCKNKKSNKYFKTLKFANQFYSATIK